MFSLFGGPRSDHLCTHGRADDVRALAHVAHSEHETQLAVALADHSVAREQQCLRALLGPRHLGEDDTHHECLQDFS